MSAILTAIFVIIRIFSVSLCNVFQKQLAKEGERILVISKYALDAKPYNTNWVRRTWEGCSLRKWLNGEFYSRAFSPAEPERIVTVDAGGQMEEIAEAVFHAVFKRLEEAEAC